MRFKNQTVMITGSCHNTGREIAKTFAEEGARVIVNGLTKEDTQSIADEISSEFSTKVIQAVFDISKPKEVNHFFDNLQENVCIDVLVNNAVIQTQGYSFTETPYEVMEQTFRVNTMGVFHCSQRVAQMMIKQKSGAIVNIGSNTVMRPIINRSAYIASKGAVDALTRAMALDLAKHNIRVNMVVAGYIHSDRWESLTEKEIKRRRANIPLGKESSARDIANAVLFLASKEASSATGTSLSIDGGVLGQLVPLDCDY